MTENEAINHLQLNRPFAYSELQNAVDIAIKALEEIKQYRAIGTVEELKEVKVIYNEILLSEGKLNLPKKCFAYEVGKLREKELREYKAIGTIEEFKALKENQCKCEDCAGCTNWKCDCANERAYAIDEFAERMKELHECGEISVFGWCRIVDEIAEEMRGAE